ncbi:MAG: SCO family protein [Myxococcota bacterium]|nr:SCO family protein [Myxococcota bacterium]
MSAGVAPGESRRLREESERPTPQGMSANRTVLPRALRRGAIGTGAVVLALALALITRFLRPRTPLPVLGHIPNFQLIDEHARPFTSAAMLGHVNVVDFIFTRCTSSCPKLTARMAELQGRIASHADDVRIVSFSVDPENDTPAVLADYAARARGLDAVDLRHWDGGRRHAGRRARVQSLGGKGRWRRE